jgi:hypothetical protein
VVIVALVGEQRNQLLGEIMLPSWICHGNENSLRVRFGDYMFMGTITIHKLRIGPRGGIYWSKGLVNLDNPDWHRRYVSGSNRTIFAEERPFPLAKWCEKCGFLFEGGWEFKWGYENPKVVIDGWKYNPQTGEISED